MIFFKRRWTIRVCFLLLALLLAGGSGLSAQPISKEYQIKAVFLFNFAQFVTWPSDAFASPDQPFCIGILGDDPFGTFMDETVKGEKVNGHPLVIQRYASVDDVKNCQILFVSSAQSSQIQNILNHLQGTSVLTVGDHEGFTNDGGIIRFFNQDNKIHLRINVEAAKRSNLSISSKMLRLAQIVELEKE